MCHRPHVDESALASLNFFHSFGQNNSPFPLTPELTPPRTPELKDKSDSCSNSEFDAYTSHRSNYLTVPGQPIAKGDSCFSLFESDQVNNCETSLHLTER